MGPEKKSSWRCHKCRERRNSYQVIVSNGEKEISTLKQKRDKGDDDESDASESSKKIKANTPKTPKTIATNPDALHLIMQNMDKIALQITSVNAKLEQQQTTLIQINDKLTNITEPLNFKNKTKKRTIKLKKWK